MSKHLRLPDRGWAARGRKGGCEKQQRAEAQVDVDAKEAEFRNTSFFELTKAEKKQAPA